METQRQDGYYRRSDEEAKGYLLTSEVKLEEGAISQLVLIKVLKQRQNRCRDKQLLGMNIGHWSPREKRMYFLFLYEHQSHFFNRQMRRLDKIFKAMAIFIGTRAADQCRSHHQKIQKKYHTFENILLSLRQHYDEERLFLPVKIEHIHSYETMRMFDESHDSLHNLEQIPPPLLPQQIKFENREPTNPVKFLDNERQPLDNQWNLGQELDQLHYL